MSKRNPFKVYKLGAANDWLEYIAWYDDVPKSISFTINDGRVPGSVSSLPSNEFWRIFMTMPQYGLYNPSEFCRTKAHNTWPQEEPHGLWLGVSYSLEERTGSLLRFDTPADAIKKKQEILEKNPHLVESYKSLEWKQLPPLEKDEIHRVRTQLETFIKTLDQTRIILGSDPVARDESGAANIDCYAANIWHIAWEIVHGIRDMPTNCEPQSRKEESFLHQPQR